MKALSIRQPWAWLIVNGHKHIENRDWPTKFRGRFLIHASKGMTRQEYEDTRDFAGSLGVEIPGFDQLDRGGVVGVAHLYDCVDQAESPWFFGKYGFVVDSAEPVPFMPYKGQLGFFEVPTEALQLSCSQHQPSPGSPACTATRGRGQSKPPHQPPNEPDRCSATDETQA